MAPKTVYIIGTGQIGSRHLQALKAVRRPLIIWAIDPHTDSLKRARERYEAMPTGKAKHTVYYQPIIPRDATRVDLAIIATTSDVRRETLEELLRQHHVSYLVLEKLLFNKRQDYPAVTKLLNASKTKAWVNCLRRMIPGYAFLQKELRGKKIHYHVSGSNLRLASNAIHFVDHAAGLTGSSDFRVITDGLHKKLAPSKRTGFLELTGTLEIQFKNGSTVSISSHPHGSLPPISKIETDDVRYLFQEPQNRGARSTAALQWRWRDIPFKYPLQSQLSTSLVETILAKGICLLPTYSESQKIHLQLLESLRLFLNKQGKKKFDHYPFT